MQKNIENSNDISTSKIYCDKIYPKNKNIEIDGLKIGKDTSNEKHILAQDENGIYYINSKGLKCYFAVNEADKNGKPETIFHGLNKEQYEYVKAIRNELDELKDEFDIVLGEIKNLKNIIKKKSSKIIEKETEKKIDLNKSVYATNSLNLSQFGAK